MTRRGFTKVELLTVIAIIAILAAILFPVFAKAREKARASSCRANLFSIGLALRGYALDHDGRYPPTEDDLAALWPRYLNLAQALICPSVSSGTPQYDPKLGVLPTLTSYYYRAGRRHNQLPRAPLCSDQQLAHNDRANVLYSDGSLALLPAGPWAQAGFHEPAPRSPAPGAGPGGPTGPPSGPPGGPPSGPPPGPQPSPAPGGG